MGFFDGIVSTVAGGLLGAWGQSESNEDNKELSREQMAFQERMSSTAHRREVADLKLAGLNPMLSAKLGGSSTPVGSMARMENVGDAAVRGASASQANQLMRAQIEQTESQTEVNKATANKVTTDARLSMASALQGEYAVRQNDARERLGYLDMRALADLEDSVTDFWDSTQLTKYYKRNLTAQDNLDDLAAKMGYPNFIAATESQQFKQALQNYQRMQYDLPRGKALSDFYRSPFGHDVAPYLNSANDMMNLGAGAVGTGIKLFRHFK